MASSSSSTTSATADSQVLIPSLPNDVATNILASIPRSHHPTLSLVSRTFRSLISSPLLYTTRALLNSSQPFLYISIRFHTATPSLRWFTLYQSSQSNSNHNNDDKFLLVPLPPTPSSLVGSAFASVGPRIYVIGGSVNDIPSQSVWCLDCRVHAWEPAPSMRISREFAAAGVVDGRIYVIGGCMVDTCARSRNWAEVFDTVTGEWGPVDSSGDGEMVREKWMHASAVVGGRVYAMADRSGVVYEPRTGRWGSVGSELDMGWRGRACVIGGVLYCYDFMGKIRGFDVGNDEWKELRGVENDLPRFLCGATMANLGGNLAVVWEEKEKGCRSGSQSGSRRETEIWCAEIEVEVKGKTGELWGRILWCGVIHRVPVGSTIVHCLGVTV